MAFQQYKSLNLPSIDTEVLKFWKEQQIFERSVTEREGQPSFVFYEGPPSANGMPGIHHVMARAVKDLFCRYQTMKGKQVSRKAGWDTHGLPIELAVEKELGITKEDIGVKISVDDYNHKCRETVMRYTDVWDDLTTKMGYWVDLQNPYVTYHNQYIESVWWLLSKLHKKGLLYKGFTIQPYSPAAGTGLSSHELNQPGCYREVKDTSAVAMFKVERNEKSSFLFQSEDEDVRIMAWTTTPWTLPSNTALAVGGDITYVKVNTFNPYTGTPASVVMAEALVSKWFKAEGAEADMSFEKGQKLVPYRIGQSYKGKELEGVRYEQLLPYAQPTDGDAFRVIVGDFVSTEDGTGIVHIAPSFGADDFRVAKQNGIGSLTLVDRRGRFTPEVTDFANEFVKADYLSEEEKASEAKRLGTEKYLSVDERIVIKLKTENKCFNAQKYEHNYPHCWRTDKPILYYPLDSWFVKASSLRDRMADFNKRKINWKPAATGTGRFQNWLENLNDWNLSRSRYWGIPLPIWRTEDGSEEICIPSIEELRKEIANALTSNDLLPETIEANKLFLSKIEQFQANGSDSNDVTLDLHRPYIDAVVLLSDSGQPMKRELDLIDVWFDSGAMPFAQQHFPFEGKEVFHKNYPADFIAEGVDQTRGWFYTLHAISNMLAEEIAEEMGIDPQKWLDSMEGGIAYKNVVSNGLVLDKDGRKMSKRLGNAVDPAICLPKYGADATRWYMITNSPPWDNLRFSWEKETNKATGEVTREWSPGIEEVQRSFFGTLYNTYSFFALYANIDGISKEHLQPEASGSAEIDRWIISKLNTLSKEVDEAFAEYEPTRAGRLIAEFVDEHLSNWYVRLCRRRFWKGELNADKRSAYRTLYTCLSTISKLMAPISPFFADWLYRNLNQATGLESHDSVHLAFFPQADASLIDTALEQRMEYAQRISSLVLSLRKREVLRVRQPLQKILIPIIDDKFEAQVELVKDLILSEVNVKELHYVRDTEGMVSKSIKPNFKTLGARLGKYMKEFQAAVNNFGQTDISQVEKQGWTFKAEDGTEIATTIEDFVISTQDIPGWLVASENGLTVALDVTLTPALEAEGVARELVNRIQNIRKDSDFEVTDRINVILQRLPQVEAAVASHTDYIQSEVLATSLTLSDTVPNGTEIELLEGQMIQIAVTKA